MKKFIIPICIAILLTTTSEAKLKYKEKFTLIEYMTMGNANITIEAIVEHNGKKCKRSYITGYVSSSETNSCTKKVDTVVHRVGTTLVQAGSVDDNVSPDYDKVVKSRNLEDYMQAYEALTGNNQYKSGYSLIHAINSKNVEIYCTTNMKICKTRKEIYAVPQQ